MVAIFSLILGVTGVIFWFYQSTAMEKVFRDRLRDMAERVVAEVAPQLPGVTPAELRDAAERGATVASPHRLVVDVFDATGMHAVSGRPPIVDPSTLDISGVLATGEPVFINPPSSVLAGVGGEALPARGVLIPTLGGDLNSYVVFLATTDQYAREQVALLRDVLLIAGVVGAAAAAVSAWFIAGIAVSPFERLQRMARQLGPESLDRSIEMSGSNTEVAELAGQLDDARQRIQEAFAAQERFLSNVSHEIKTPIAVLLTEAETLDLRGTPPAVSDFVASAREEMHRLGRLVESFLTLTRIKDGHASIRGVPYAANDLVMDSVEHCAVMAEQNKVWLKPDLFADDGWIDTAVSGEPELLRTMLDNLILNAIRFSPSDGRVQIRLERAGDWVRVSVRDEGPGIPAHRLETIFDRFSQGADEQRRGRGHGLGLAIAQGIAELHGGAIAAANRNGAGCEFIVSLPRLGVGED